MRSQKLTFCFVVLIDALMQEICRVKSPRGSQDQKDWKPLLGINMLNCGISSKRNRIRKVQKCDAV